MICKYLTELVSLRETQGYLSFRSVYLEKSGLGKGGKTGSGGNTNLYALHPEQESVYPTNAEEFIHIRKQKHAWCLNTQELERGYWSKELEVGPFEAEELE